MKITQDNMQALVDAYDRMESGIESIKEWLEAKESGGETPSADDRETIRDARDSLDGEMEEVEAAIAELAELLPKPKPKPKPEPKATKYTDRSMVSEASAAYRNRTGRT